jgi:hypothetical protein
MTDLSQRPPLLPPTMPIHYPDASKLAEGVRGRLNDLQSRWGLFLGIGNGAALVALGSKVLDLRAAPATAQAVAAVGFVYPSMILFAFGLMASGWVPLSELRATHGLLREQRGFLQRLGSGEEIEVNAFPHADGHWDAPRNWWPEILAAGCFVAGLGWPLISMVTAWQVYLPRW